MLIQISDEDRTLLRTIVGSLDRRWDNQIALKALVDRLDAFVLEQTRNPDIVRMRALAYDEKDDDELDIDQDAIVWIATKEAGAHVLGWIWVEDPERTLCAGFCCDHVVRVSELDSDGLCTVCHDRAATAEANLEEEDDEVPRDAQDVYDALMDTLGVMHAEVVVSFPDQTTVEVRFPNGMVTKVQVKELIPPGATACSS